MYLCIWGHREYTRETREGWPLLTVEAKANQGVSTYERGPSLVGSLGLSCQYKRSVSYLVWSSRPVQNTSFLTVHYYFTSFVPIAQLAGQAVVPVRLSLNMCHWNTLSYGRYRTKQRLVAKERGPNYQHLVLWCFSWNKETGGVEMFI